MGELHFGDQGRKWGCEDPRPDARRDPMDLVRQRAALAKEIAQTQQMSGADLVENTRSFMPRPVINPDWPRSAFVDVSDGTVKIAKEAPIDWSTVDEHGNAIHPDTVHNLPGRPEHRTPEERRRALRARWDPLLDPNG